MKSIDLRSFEEWWDELQYENGCWFHYAPPDCRGEWDMKRPITPTKAHELVASAKQRAFCCLAAIQKEIAQCEEFERLLRTQP